MQAGRWFGFRGVSRSGAALHRRDSGRSLQGIRGAAAGRGGVPGRASPVRQLERRWPAGARALASPPASQPAPPVASANGANEEMWRRGSSSRRGQVAAFLICTTFRRENKIRTSTRSARVRPSRGCWSSCRSRGRSRALQGVGWAVDGGAGAGSLFHRRWHAVASRLCNQLRPNLALLEWCYLGWTDRELGRYVATSEIISRTDRGRRPRRPVIRRTRRPSSTDFVGSDSKHRPPLDRVTGWDVNGLIDPSLAALRRVDAEGKTNNRGLARVPR